MNEWGLKVLLADDVAEVGGVFSGTIDRDPDRGPAPSIRGARVLLQVCGAGDGDPSVRQVAGVQVEVQDDGRVANTFEFPVPDDGPVSYEGRTMSLEWRIEVQVDLSQGRDQQFHVPLLVLPRGGTGIYKRAHPLRRQDYPSS